MKAGFMSFDSRGIRQDIQEDQRSSASTAVKEYCSCSLLAEMKKGCSYEFITHNYILVF